MERGGAEISPISYPQIARDTLVSVTSLLYFSACEHCKWAVGARAAGGGCEKPCLGSDGIPESRETARGRSCKFLVLKGGSRRRRGGWSWLMCDWRIEKGQNAVLRRSNAISGG